MDSRVRYQKSIGSVYPELTIHTAIQQESGQNHDILLVNDELLFRFPKYRQGIEGLAREHEILQGVRLQLPLATPDFVYHNVDQAEVGRAFVGYHKLPGESLWTETFAQIDDDRTIARLATDLASFLQTLHSIPASRINYPLPQADTQADWRAIFGRIQQVVYPHLSEQARAWTTQQFGRFLENADHFAFTSVLRHGDFGTSNILYGAEEQRVTGVVDFGHAGLGDPAVDFAGLCVSFGESFLNRCTLTYPLIDSCWERIRFYAGCAFMLEDALFCVEHDTAEAADVIAEINKVGSVS